MSRMNYWLNRWFGEKQAGELGVFFAFLVITILYGPTEILDIFSHHLKWPHLEREYSTKMAINFNIWLSLKRRKSPFISQTPLKHAQEHGTNVPEMRLLKLRSRIIYTIKSEVKKKQYHQLPCIIDFKRSHESKKNIMFGKSYHLYIIQIPQISTLPGPLPSLFTGT